MAGVTTLRKHSGVYYWNWTHSPEQNFAPELLKGASVSILASTVAGFLKKEENCHFVSFLLIANSTLLGESQAGNVCLNSGIQV